MTQSEIPQAGLGLYATRDFEPGQLISLYDGRHLTKEELDRIYPGDDTAGYAIRLNNNLYIDANRSNDPVARYANTCDEPRLPHNLGYKKCYQKGRWTKCKVKKCRANNHPKKTRKCCFTLEGEQEVPCKFHRCDNNALFIPNARKRQISLKACRKIRAGEEVYTSYGNNYGIDGQVLVPRFCDYRKRPARRGAHHVRGTR